MQQGHRLLVGVLALGTWATFATPAAPAAFDEAAAHAVLVERTAANRGAFHLFRDGDWALNKGFPSGHFGELDAISTDTGCLDDPAAANGCSTDPVRLDRVRGTVMRVTFDALPPRTFAGLNIEEPENWGSDKRGRGYDLRGATHVRFDARSPDGLSVRIGVDGASGSLLTLPAGGAWQSFSIDLAGLGLSTTDLADVHVLLTIGTDAASDPSGGTVLLDDIRFEPVPVTQSAAIGFPLSTETFGSPALTHIDPGRVPVPPDQVNRGVTTIYESAIVLDALLRRGTPADRLQARAIADAFVYALGHDNAGLPLPASPDGSRGLHSAYAGGDLALYNSQLPGQGLQGQVRLAGFSGSFCGPSQFCLVLDGATSGNNAFAILALLAAHRAFDAPAYLDAALTIAKWIYGNLADLRGTGYGGYYLGYPDEGRPKVLISAKSIENNADIFSAFSALAAAERQAGRDGAVWDQRATHAGDFVMAMLDDASGCFLAGTVPEGTPYYRGIRPDGPLRGDDRVNTYPFADAQTFTVMALAASARYREAIDWRRPVACLDAYRRPVIAAGREFAGIDLVKDPPEGPAGNSWEFTGQAVRTMRLVDRLYGETRFASRAAQLLDEIEEVQRFAPYGDGRGLVASVLSGGELLVPLDHCLTTPFQCIPARVGLAATAWGIFASRDYDPLSAPFEPIRGPADPLRPHPPAFEPIRGPADPRRPQPSPSPPVPHSPKPPPPKSCRIEIRGSALRLHSRGRIFVRVRCRGGARGCSGTLRLTATAPGVRGRRARIAAAARWSIAPRRTRRVTVRLTAHQARQVRRVRRLRVRVLARGAKSCAKQQRVRILRLQTRGR